VVVCAEESGRATRAASGNGETRSAIPTPSFAFREPFRMENGLVWLESVACRDNWQEADYLRKQTQNRPSF
jgi:hypothetical protein